MQSDVIFSFQYPECGTASLEFNLIQEQRAYHRQMALLMLFWFHVTVFSPDIGQDQNVTGTMLMCFKRRGVGVHNPSFGLFAHANTLCKFFCNMTCIIWFHIRVSATIVVRCLKWLINMSLINSKVTFPNLTLCTKNAPFIDTHQIFLCPYATARCESSPYAPHVGTWQPGCTSAKENATQKLFKVCPVLSETAAPICNVSPQETKHQTAALHEQGSGK